MAAHGAADSSPIDRARAMQHFGDTAIMDNLLQRFPSSIVSTVERLHDAIEKGNVEEMREKLARDSTPLRTLRFQVPFFVSRQSRIARPRRL